MANTSKCTAMPLQTCLQRSGFSTETETWSVTQFKLH